MSDNNTEPVVQALKVYKKRSQIGEIFYSIRKNTGALMGLIILILLFLMAIYSVFFISWESVTETNILSRFSPPSAKYPFGTDNLGRNVLLRLVYGSRYSLIIGFVTVGVASFIGATLGAVSSYYGGLAESVTMRFMDIIAAVPGLLLGMVIISVMGQSIRNLIIAVTITYIPTFTRISRAAILTVKNQEFVEAARATGFSNARVIFTQVLPNGLSPIIVQITVNLGQAIILAASLSFMGFGVPTPAPEWGGIIANGREFIRTAWWMMTFPGIFIMLTVLALNQLGDGLRDALDPKMKRR